MCYCCSYRLQIAVRPRTLQPATRFRTDSSLTNPEVRAISSTVLPQLLDTRYQVAVNKAKPDQSITKITTKTRPGQTKTKNHTKPKPHLFQVPGSVGVNVPLLIQQRKKPPKGVGVLFVRHGTQNVRYLAADDFARHVRKPVHPPIVRGGEGKSKGERER